MPATVTVVDVGQGDCTVAVDGHTKQALLIDCPDRRHEEAITALNQLGFGELNAVVVTHSHLDHFGGVLEVIDEFKDRFTGKIYFNQDTLPAMASASGWPKSKLESLYLRILEFDTSQADRADSGIGPQSLGTTSWTLVAPAYLQVVAAVHRRNPNLASGIVLIESDGHCMVVGGDAPLSSWQSIRAQLPPGAVVRWPHHGGRISNSRTAQGKLSDQSQLLNLLQPSHVLVSVGGNNPHGHPQDEFFQAVQQRKLAPMCTQATSKCTEGSNGAKCAGSITVELGTGSGPNVTPERTNHAQFVATLANPQCI